MDLNELSAKLTSDFTDINIQSRHILKIFLCGSYTAQEDKTCIMEARDEIRDEIRIPGVFIMEDIGGKEIDSNNLQHKFHLIWQEIMKGDNIPLCIIYVGQSAKTSTGLAAEIADIARDNEKKMHTHIIRLEGAETVSHINEFSYHTVKNSDEFKVIAKNIVKAKIEEIKANLINVKKD